MVVVFQDMDISGHIAIRTQCCFRNTVSPEIEEQLKRRIINMMQDLLSTWNECYMLIHPSQLWITCLLQWGVWNLSPMFLLSQQLKTHYLGPTWRAAQCGPTLPDTGHSSKTAGPEVGGLKVNSAEHDCVTADWTSRNNSSYPWHAYSRPWLEILKALYSDASPCILEPL